MSAPHALGEQRPATEGARDAQAVQVLVDNHRAFLAFLERRLGDRRLAEDVLSEAFVRGLEKVGTLRDGESAVAWFYRSLRNAIVDLARRRDVARRGLTALLAEMGDAAEPARETREEVCACVSRLAATLKPEYAEALRRVEVEGLPVKDLAAQLGISPNNAAVRLHRARQALEREVRRSCGTCATHGCLDCTCSAASPAP